MDVYGVGIAMATARELEQLRQSCEADLRIAVDAARHHHPRVGFDFFAVNQQPDHALLVEAEEADLVVVGSNGLGATKNFLLGTVLGTVLHQSPCPVAVVPPELHASTGRIVVGVDGSESSSAALLWAADEAARSSADLCVVHAWEYPYGFTNEGLGRGMAFAEVDAGIVLEKAVDLARDRMTGTVVGELIEGGPTQALLDTSTTADLIIVGSRGRGGFRSMLLGSVAQAVSARAQCPVVVVR